MTSHSACFCIVYLRVRRILAKLPKPTVCLYILLLLVLVCDETKLFA